MVSEILNLQTVPLSIRHVIMDIKTASMLLILQYWSSLYKASKYISYLIAYNARYVFRLATKWQERIEKPNKYFAELWLANISWRPLINLSTQFHISLSQGRKKSKIEKPAGERHLKTRVWQNHGNSCANMLLWLWLEDRHFAYRLFGSGK